MTGPSMPGRCPACSGPMQVEKLRCASCGTEVQGQYRPCPACALDPEARRLLDLFLRFRGNLRDVQRALSVSYPTARARLDGMFAKLDLEAPQDAMGILRKVREGELSVDDAVKALRGG